jgi:hypothetical protein
VTLALLLSLVLALVAALLGVAASRGRRWVLLIACGLCCQVAIYNAALIVAGEVTLQ